MTITIKDTSYWVTTYPAYLDGGADSEYVEEHTVLRGDEVLFRSPSLINAERYAAHFSNVTERIRLREGSRRLA